MEDRRNPKYDPDNAIKPADLENSDRYPKKPGNRAFGENRAHSPKEGFRPNVGGFKPKADGFRSADERFQSRDPRIGSRSGSSGQNRSGGFAKWDNRYPRLESNLQRDSRFPNRPPGRLDRGKKAGGKPENRTGAPEKSADNSHIKVYSELQITDGKHRGKFFENTASPKVRLTTRKIRETLFRFIGRRVRAGRFLDLCAGSGVVGLEAISHGALLATFVESSSKMCSFIRKNMKALEIKDGHGEVRESEAIPFLKHMAQRGRLWDVVYLDPPYDADYDEILEYFKRGITVKYRGILIIEHHAEMFFPERLGVMTRWKVVIEDESALSFYVKK